MSLTPYMGLDLPTPTVTIGPLWASQLNTAISGGIDSHNHTSGKGAPIPTSAISINSDLTFNSYSAIDLKSTRFTNQGSPLAAPEDLGCLYTSGAGSDLYFNDGAGNQIQLTINGALNAASVGGIGGDYATSTASVFYTSLSTTFTFWQSTGVSATLDIGDLIIRYEASSAFGVRITASNSMSANYSVTLPVSLPASQKFMTLDNTGNIAAPWSVDNNTIQIVSNQLVAQPQNFSGTDREHAWEVNGSYGSLTYPNTNIDAIFLAPYNLTITSVWIYSGTAGSSGTSEFDLKKGTSGGSFTTILSTTGKITSAAASNVWTDSGSVVSAQTGVTKAVISNSSMTAGEGLRFDMIQAMVGGIDARIRIFYKQS